jgi:cyclophilin family peptidyl-prolyl cis-trans isomerase
MRMSCFRLLALFALLLLSVCATSVWAQSRILKPLPPRLSGPDGLRIDLSEYFLVPPTDRTTVQVSTPLGRFNMELLEAEAPLTTANFLSYMHDGVYDNSLIHRSVPGFVIQTGGFTASMPPSPVETRPPVRNEFRVPNTRGTVAMAKLGGDPDSATSQWFVNLADNRANLDSQNGGFTVFARVLGDGMTVVDALASVPVYNADNGGVFGSIPLRDIKTGQTKVSAANLLPIGEVYRLPLDVRSSNPQAWSAALDGSALRVRPGPVAGRPATITVRAADLEGRVLTSSFVVKSARARLYQGIGTSPSGPVHLTVSLTPAGWATVVARREAGPPLRGRVSLDLLDGTEVVYAHDGSTGLGFVYQPERDVIAVVPRSDNITAFELRPAAWTGRGDAVSPLDGRRANVLLDDGAGGYLQIRFARTGAARLVGRLATGPQTVTFSAGCVMANDTNHVLLPVPFFAARGPTASLTGDLRVGFDGDPGLLPLGGTLRQITREVGPRDLSASGAFWERPARNSNVLVDGDDEDTGFRLLFGDAGMALGLPEVYSDVWPSSNRIRLPKGSRVSRFRFNAATGAIAGQVLVDAPVGGRPSSSPFWGVVTGRMDKSAVDFRGAGFASLASGLAATWELRQAEVHR